MQCMMGVHQSTSYIWARFTLFPLKPATIYCMSCQFPNGSARVKKCSQAKRNVTGSEAQIAWTSGISISRFQGDPFCRLLGMGNLTTALQSGANFCIFRWCARRVVVGASAAGARWMAETRRGVSWRPLWKSVTAS